jgi:hypothetical protein
MEKVPNAFLHYNYAAGTVQEAMSQYASGAKEVYVSGSLAADTRALTELIGKVKIRLIPNVVQTNAFTFGNPGNIDPFQCFWLRPEGVKHYEYIVDIMEFAFVEGQEDREAAMLHFYDMGEYKNKLGLLITDNTGKLNTIDSLFHQEIDESKSKCGLKCQSGGSCSICSRIPQQATILRQAMKIYKEDDFS